MHHTANQLSLSMAQNSDNLLLSECHLSKFFFIKQIGA